MATEATTETTTTNETSAAEIAAADHNANTAAMSAMTADANENPALDFEAAGDILDAAGGGDPSRTDGALGERTTADPLADSEEADPLAGHDDLDRVLGGDEEWEDELAGGADDGADAREGLDAEESGAPRSEGEAVDPAADYSRMPARIAAIMRHADAARCSFEDAEMAIFGAVGGAEHASYDEGAMPGGAGGFDAGEVERELESLRAQRRQAAEDFTNPTRALELTEQIEARQMMLATERARRQMQEAENAVAREQHAVAVLDDMYSRFPGAFAPGHPLHDAILMDRNRILQSNPAFFADPDWAETPVRKHASRLGIASTKPGATAAPHRAAMAARHGAPPKRTARPLPAPGGRSATPHQLTEAGMSRAIRTAQARGDAATLDFILRHGRVPASA